MCDHCSEFHTAPVLSAWPTPAVLELLQSGLHPTARLFSPPVDGSATAERMARGDDMVLARATYGMVMYIERGCRLLAGAVSWLRRYAAGRNGAWRERRAGI